MTPAVGKPSNRGRKNLGPMPVSMLRHGEASTYGNYGCRCPLCSDAWNVRSKKYRDAARLRRSAP